MNTYIITITETLQKEVKEKAASPEAALSKVKQDYRTEIHVLDSSDYIDTEFSINKGG